MTTGQYCLDIPQSAVTALRWAAGDYGTDGVCGPTPGLLAIVEEFHTVTDFDIGDVVDGTAATVYVSAESNVEDGNVNRRCECRGQLTIKCDMDADCPKFQPADTHNGLCRTQTTKVCNSDLDCANVAGDFCDICMNDEILLAG